MKKVFWICSLAAFLSACGEAPTEEAEEVSEPSGPSIQGQEIDYTSGDVVLKGYLAYDESSEEKRPGILVVHEWWGHNDYARRRADMLAELGYTALAVDMYGDGKTADHPENAQQFMGEVMQNMDEGEARFRAALAILKDHPSTDPERVAAIGYCFGGAVVLHMARIGEDLDGVVSFHGDLSSMATPEPGSVEAKVLVLHGADDSFISDAAIESFKEEMETAGVDYRFVAYEGAKHSFTNPDADEYAERFGMDLAYDESADEASWAEMQRLFDEIF